MAPGRFVSSEASGPPTPRGSFPLAPAGHRIAGEIAAAGLTAGAVAVNLDATAGLALQTPDREAVEVAAAVAGLRAEPLRRAAAAAAVEPQDCTAGEGLAAALAPVVRPAMLPRSSAAPFSVFLLRRRCAARAQPEE